MRGHVQRAEHLRRLQARPWKSELAGMLKEQFAFGLLSAAQAQIYAHAAVRDHGESSPGELIELASIGSEGRHLNHCHRDLLIILRKIEAPSPTAFSLLQKKKRGLLQAETSTNHAMQLPSDIVSHLYNHYPKGFARRFLGTESVTDARVALLAFWDGVPNADPRKALILRKYRSICDFAAEADLWGRLVPLALHGDGVPVAGQSFEAITISGILGRQLSSADAKIFISGTLSQCKSRSTSSQFWSNIVLALQVLAEGKFPTEDLDGDTYVCGPQAARAGANIAGGLMFVIFMIRADLDFLANSLQLESSTGAGGMCCWCKANNLEEPLDDWAVAFDLEAASWSDLSPIARWRHSTWTCHEDWLRWKGGINNVHPVFTLPGVSVFSIMADVLHTLDLGVTKAALGNLLYEVCYGRGLLGGIDPDARLSIVWSFITRQYRSRKTPAQLHGLTINMFVDKSRPHAQQPFLSGLAKAAISRHLVPILRDFWQENYDASLLEHRQILGMLDALVSIYESFHVDTFMLSADQVRSLQQSVDDFLDRYRWLHAQSGAFRWAEYPKFHGLQHIRDQAACQNPRWGWTYIDEDWMSLAKSLCRSCLYGTASHVAMPKLVEKWTLGFFARVARQEAGE